MGNSGYVFWGVRLRELYMALGVEVNDSLWLELMPAGILEGEIESKIRLLGAFMVFSALLVGFLWGSLRGYAVLYAILIMIPRGFVALWDLRAHTKLRVNKVTTSGNRLSRKNTGEKIS